jgi:exonuclease VII large subunit
VIVVARGGGSLTDLLAFSDEALCRTVALLRCR